ncbi:MAG: hypothetical protein EPO35_12210 [Acidobacteria bacterium]|nr:MAG: hypothetical protein EPO35_12210 [Acidobacteriota bacterium]
MTPSRARFLLIAGLVLMIAGALDPMEGSVVILAGSALAAIAAYFGHLPRARAIELAFVLITVGVAALFGFSAVGGIGGTSKYSMWWVLTMVPYPIGWIVGLAATISALRASRKPVTA